MPNRLPEKPERRRWWKWTRRILLSLFVSLAGFAFSRWLWWEYTYAQGEKELAAAISETEAIDPRWRWEQIEEDKPEVPDEENSLLVVKKFEASLEKWKPSSLSLPNGQSLLPEKIDNHRLDDDRIAMMRKELAEHATSVNIALSLKDYPRGQARLQLKPNVLNTSLAHTQACRIPAAVLLMDIERLLHERNADSPWLRVQAILHTGAGLRDECLLISQLVRIALRIIAARRVERILAMSEPGVDDLKAMEAHFTAEEREELLIPALRGERAMFTILFENLSSGRITMSDVGERHDSNQSWDEEIGWKLYKARLPADQAYHLRTMRKLIAIAGLPSHERMRKLDDFRNRFLREAIQAKEDKERIVSTLLLPAVDKVAEASIRDKALLRCTITALAAERYRIANNKWPTTLNDLCPKLMDQVPLDAFDGNSLKYTFRDDGVTIYSVGADGQDNGGLNLTPTGKEPGADLGFRLWNVDQRGLPAEVKPKGGNQP